MARSSSFSPPPVFSMRRRASSRPMRPKPYRTMGWAVAGAVASRATRDASCASKKWCCRKERKEVRACCSPASRAAEYARDRRPRSMRAPRTRARTSSSRMGKVSKTSRRAEVESMRRLPFLETTETAVEEESRSAGFCDSTYFDALWARMISMTETFTIDLPKTDTKLEQSRYRVPIRGIICSAFASCAIHVSSSAPDEESAISEADRLTPGISIGTNKCESEQEQ
mmetsp:Transcript_5705/g.18560  ORF Transcript_5705/g.18560 Transcript_5705/m.18560 type:complete len:227 (-) Transcript_5705:65-745(-)